MTYSCFDSIDCLVDMEYIKEKNELKGTPIKQVYSLAYRMLYKHYEEDLIFLNTTKKHAILDGCSIEYCNMYLERLLTE